MASAHEERRSTPQISCDELSTLRCPTFPKSSAPLRCALEICVYLAHICVSDLQFCQRYFSLLLPCTTCVALWCNRGRIGTALGLTRNSALYFNCLPFSRFGDNIFIPLSTRLLAAPNCVQGGTRFLPNGAAETLRHQKVNIWLAGSSHLSYHLYSPSRHQIFNSLAVYQIHLPLLLLPTSLYYGCSRRLPFVLKTLSGRLRGTNYLTRLYRQAKRASCDTTAQTS